MYGPAYETAIQDDRTYVETLYTSLTGSYITRSSAVLSTLSSILILVIILRSSAKLNIPYHRIMFGMSVADFCASVAMALTTLPMPKDMIYTQFEGKHIGTFGTCAAQSFFQNSGSLATLLYNVALSIYYYYSIRARNKMTKKWIMIEIFLHVTCISVPIGLVGYTVSLETMNPTPYLPWCGTFVEYPYYCKEDECMIRGHLASVRKRSSPYIFGLPILAVIIVMVMIVMTVYQDEKVVKMYRNLFRYRFGSHNAQKLQRSARQLRRSTDNYRLSKTMSIQAASYIFALLISLSCIFLRILARDAMRENTALQVYHLSTRPLQGFFNLLVFVSDKAYSYRNANPDVSMIKACCYIIMKPEERSFVFDHMSIVVIESNKEKNTEMGESHKDNVAVHTEFPIPFHTSVKNSPGSALKDDASSLHADRSNDPSAALSDSKNFDIKNVTKGKAERKIYYKEIRDQYGTEGFGDMDTNCLKNTKRTALTSILSAVTR